MESADRYKRAHMVGIGGVGMAALARLLKAQGMCITGSDLTSSSTLQGLAQDGFTVSEGHSAAQLGDVSQSACARGTRLTSLPAYTPK